MNKTQFAVSVILVRYNHANDLQNVLYVGMAADKVDAHKLAVRRSLDRNPGHEVISVSSIEIPTPIQ